MKICIYNVTSTTHFGGLETYCWQMGQALAALDHLVTLVAGEVANVQEAGAKAESCGITLRCFHFSTRQSFPDLGSRFGKLMERLSFAKQAMPWLLRQNFDAVIIVKPFDMPALWWARRRGMKAVTILASGGVDFFAADRIFCSSVDYLVACSTYNARQLEARYGRTGEIIPYGADVQSFTSTMEAARQVRAELAIPAQATLCISVGRLVGWKGLHIVVQAISRLPNVHFLIVGDGEERQRLQDLAQKLEVGARIHFAGRVEHAKLPRFFSASDLFVQPSIGEEAFGISVVEAMSTSLPVLVSKNGGMVDFVRDGIDGLILPPADVNAWRQAIDTLSRDRDRRQQMAMAGNAQVSAHYSWKKNAEAVLRLVSKGQ